MDTTITPAMRIRELLDLNLREVRFGLWPERLAADAGYGDAANPAWLVEQRSIEPHVPVFDKSARTDGTFERAAFTYDREDDRYVCPGGKRLRPRNRNFSRPRSNVDQDGFIRYRARQEDFGGCALRSRCTPNMPARKVMRSFHEGSRDMAQAIADSDAWLVSRRQRKNVEMLFARLKRILKLDRLRLRGPNGAKTSSSSPSPHRTSETREAHPTARGRRGRVNSEAAIDRRLDHTRPAPETNFFNTIPPSAAIQLPYCGPPAA